VIWINAAAGGVTEHCRMTTFDDERERAFERKFALEQELGFKVAARRNALLGRWASVRMRLDSVAADAYVAGLVVDEAVHTDPQSVINRVRADLLAHGTPASQKELSAILARVTTQARKEVVRGALR
jgi:hypothetical protein